MKNLGISGLELTRTRKNFNNFLINYKIKLV